MAKSVFTDYYMADEERLKGYTVAILPSALMRQIPVC